MPIILVRVVCGLADTIEIFWPSKEFKIEDFPTLGTPTIATKADFFPILQEVPFILIILNTN